MRHYYEEEDKFDEGNHRMGQRYLRFVALIHGARLQNAQQFQQANDADHSQNAQTLAPRNILEGYDGHQINRKPPLAVVPTYSAQIFHDAPTFVEGLCVGSKKGQDHIHEKDDVD